MTCRLRDLIREVRACKSAADERAVIAKECAAIRTKFKDDDDEFRHRNVAKLLFIHMLGHPTHFGQMACVRLVASPRFTDKRIGYLGLMLLLDESHDVLMLVTNCVKNDLNNSNMYVVGLGLTALGNISSPEMCRDLSPEVEKLLSSSNAYIRKKAALAAMRIIRKCPDLLENLLPRARALLSGSNNGVLLTGVSLLLSMYECDPEAVCEYRRQLIPVLVRMIKSLITSGYAPEHDVSGVTDPFLQVKILRLLRCLGAGDSEASYAMNDILAQVATNTETSKNVGNAILYECVLTIMMIESESGLRVLAINILGRFLLNRDNNIRYVALNTLAKVLSDDMQAVQRHRSTIVDCLRDPDISIRRRALELTYALVNENNVRSLSGELVAYLEVADAEVREDLSRKICSVAERFAPDPEWHVDTVLTVLRLAGNYVAPDVFDTIVMMISQQDSVHAYAVHQCVEAMRESMTQEKLLLLGAWCIGEYGELLGPAAGLPGVDEAEAVSLLEDILYHPSCTPLTRNYVLTALIKLTSRFSTQHDRILALIAKFNVNIDVELQQRACEYTMLYSLAQRNALLERMPVLEAIDDYEETLDDETDDNNTAAAVTGVAAAAANPPTAAAATATPAPGGAAAVGGGGGGGGGLLDVLGSAPGPAPATGGGGGGGNLLDLLSMGSAPAPAPAAGGGAGGGGGSLLDLLGGGSPAASPAVPTATPAAGGSGGGGGGGGDSFAPTVAYEKNGLRIMFEYAKQPGNPAVTAINVVVTNSNSFALEAFQFLVAVPKYIELRMQAPSGNVVPPNNSGRVTQVIRINNSAQGSKPVLMKYQLTLSVNGQTTTEQGDVANIPANL